MSLILDTLRGGRARATPPANPKTADTDAVLQTLGYGRFSATSPLKRITRLVGYVAVGILFAIVIWFTVIWITEVYLTHNSQVDIHTAPSAAMPPTAR
jgi:hypothetical protein